MSLFIVQTKCIVTNIAGQASSNVEVWVELVTQRANRLKAKI